MAAEAEGHVHVDMTAHEEVSLCQGLGLGFSLLIAWPTFYKGLALQGSRKLNSWQDIHQIMFRMAKRMSGLSEAGKRRSLACH